MSRPTAAPAHFPYAHRTLAQVAVDERKLPPTKGRKRSVFVLDKERPDECANTQSGLTDTTLVRSSADGS